MPFITLAIGGGEWSTSHPGCFSSQGKEPLGRHKSWSVCCKIEENTAPAGNRIPLSDL
jgi:hypothetical protein